MHIGHNFLSNRGNDDLEAENIRLMNELKSAKMDFALC
jgi:hypothetical protein